MKQEYKSIDDVLDDFCKSYHNLKKLRNDITKVLYGKLSVVADDESEEVSSSVANDTNFIRALSSVIDERDAVSALHIFSDVIDELRGALSAREATLRKLEERHRLQDDGSPEANVVKKKLTQCRDDIKILNDRIELVLIKFYSLRRSVITKVADYSMKIASSAYEGQYDAKASSIIRKFAMPVERLTGSDTTITEREVIDDK